ncbi:MAG: alpha/beta hydrolase family protein, partial [Bryobacteraceae bacterium]
MRILYLLSGAAAVWAQQPGAVESMLGRKILDPNQPLVEVQVYTGSRVLPMPSFRSTVEWETYATAARRRILDEVVFRGEAKKWRESKTAHQILEPAIEGDGYRIRQFRYEVIPGMWMPGVIYEPVPLRGKAPVILNLNGHEGDGTATAYIQIRCMNLAKKGFIAVNPEWLGRGQMRQDGQNHYRMNQIDLTGTSGLALFHLAMTRALDMALAMPNADASRVAVTGLSGGGWQTILLSSLDLRVKAAMPLAGYSSYVTRAQWPDLDLGDSEQTPSDLGAVADYAHMTAMLAPRAAVLAYNAKDNCCFRADYAVAPLMQAAAPIYRLYDAVAKLDYHANHGEGHNYDRDNRERFYRLLKDAFGLETGDAEMDVEKEVRVNTALRPELPVANLDFHKIALGLAERLPKPGEGTRENLSRIVRYKPMGLEAVPAGAEERDGFQARFWKLKMDRAWTVPAVEITPPRAASTVLVVADNGRAPNHADVSRLLSAGKRVVFVDPFYFGESKIARRDFLFAMLIAGLGERPLGLQASQIAAAARWLNADNKAGAVELLALGPRTGLGSLIAAALETSIESV